MAYTGYKTVAFGSSKAGLATVGYTLFDFDGNEVAARTEDGVQDLTGGQYGAVVTFPDGFVGRLTWDTGEDPPVYASEAINDADDEADVDTLEQLTALRQDVDTLVGEHEVDLDAEVATPGTAFTEVVRADIPHSEGCPLLQRLRAFVVDQTSLPELRHIFRHPATGAPVDLSAVLAAESESASASASSTAGGSVKVRISEWFHGGKVDNNKGWETDGTAVSASKGVLAFTMPEGSTDKAGLYKIEWGVLNSSGRLLASRRSFLLVQPSAFADNVSRQGPFTLEELRMSLRDSERAENYTMDDVEFGDEQIAHAIARPVELWNTETPKLSRTLTTTSFPYREQWLRATVGFLCEMAAQGYRRDAGLVDQAGGLVVKDKDKERQYAEEGARRIAEYRQFVLMKKNEIGMNGMYAIYTSPEYSGGYGGRGSW